MNLSPWSTGNRRSVGCTPTRGVPIHEHPLADGEIHVGRGYKDLQRSQWANPFSVRKWTRVGALEKFPHHLRASAWSSQLPGLASKVLSCQGDADQSCRVDVAIRTCRRGKHRKRKREETALWRRSSGCCGAPLGQVMTPRGYVWEATSVVGRETHTGLRCPRDSNFLYFTNDLREVQSCETLFHRTAASPARRRRPYRCYGSAAWSIARPRSSWPRSCRGLSS